jgi:16S rRNA (guanine527-N7)-methyltransferase
VKREREADLEQLASRWHLTPPTVDRLAALIRLLEQDPVAPTSVTDPRRTRDVHVADSLTALGVPGFRELDSVVDIGSGAGLPGLVLAIAMPAASFDLLESVGRKCAFIERAATTLELPNVGVVCARAEEWAAGAGAARYGGATSRAVGRLATNAEYAAPLLRLGGLLVVWKGRRDDEEEREGERAAALLGMRPAGVEWVGAYAGSRHRHLHWYLKSGPTPEGYPRRAGVAKKRPLGRVRSGPNERTAADPRKGERRET